uniref:Tyrosine-protein kinase receptor n=1 Tax=Trichogramma kaykai TaxID=54128 RepID=A0ABD2WEB8_9HYME
MTTTTTSTTRCVLIQRMLLLLLLLAGVTRSDQRREPRSFKDVQLMLSQQQQQQLQALPRPAPASCDFERHCTDWHWNRVNGSLRLAKPPLAESAAPTSDASKNKDGKFLYMRGPAADQLYSSEIPRSTSDCYLELAVHQVEMKYGSISLIIETFNRTSYVAAEKGGNNAKSWETIKFNLGVISQKFIIILEIRAPFANSSLAVDNIRLVNCFPDSRAFNYGECTAASMFHCYNGSACLKHDHVCDLTADCPSAEDETGECEKVPAYAKCNFEWGWCGWTNGAENPLNWTLHQGPTPTERMGPETDHTYRNSSGTYAYVDMSRKVEYGSQGTLKSPIFNPTPPYHNDTSSPYYKSCKVRFFYHQYGTHTVALGLYLVQLKPHQNHTERLWWSFKDNSDLWNGAAVVLPSIRYRYYLQFEASKSYGSKGDVAIDDVSLSPECFGIGVPADVVGDFNYYEQKIPPWSDVPPKHADFTNITVMQVTSCDQTGRFGPTPEQCLKYYSSIGNETIQTLPGTELLLEVLSEASSDEGGDSSLQGKGIQRWTVPSGGFYTLIAVGARGGVGALSMGSSLGAMARGVLELEKGQQIYFMIGQSGTDACPKKLGSSNDSCIYNGGLNGSLTDNISLVRQVKNIEPRDGGGGGGGATYIFTLKDNGEQVPLLIAGGGGGLGPTRFSDDHQHGQTRIPAHLKPVGGSSSQKDAGGGGGLLDEDTTTSSSNASNRVAFGMALTRGGVGGLGCGNNHKGHGNGGYGGGGGGCLSGGGGGGYRGGDTGALSSGNGVGGYSYASPELLHAVYEERFNPGPGRAYVIPAISGCGCDFRCVVVDQHLSETRCLCPFGWQLASDGKACVVMSEADSVHTTIFIILIVVSIGSVLACSGLFFLLYHRYQNRKAMQRRRQGMFGTELTALRVVSDNMMTEFNPNYEFAGNLYSFKDLPQIPRDNITLVKPLGQGAFGEVFQGIYKYRRGEEHPVAVKTLPVASSPSAEADFMMEALIMSKFDHPNVVHFIGVSFDKHPRFIVLELLGGGDLKFFLREERPRQDRPTSLTMRDLINCAYDVAKGCKYMEDARFIHRDIAARNCLLTCKGPGRCVKIADFGMARDIYRSDYYRKGGKAMLPIKWMPPESFLDGIFTTKTDVWAFGVTCWEIMSFGYMPYTGCSNLEVMSMVTNGSRLEKPAGCPDPVYAVMAQCWHSAPDKRPSFTTIVERIDYCLQDPDVVNMPTPNFDLLPIGDREITVVRPDPETECINVHPGLDGCGYMQPRFRPTTYRISTQPEIVYSSLKHGVTNPDQENCNDPSPAQESDYRDSQLDNREPNANAPVAPGGLDIDKSAAKNDNDSCTETTTSPGEEASSGPDTGVLATPVDRNPPVQPDNGNEIATLDNVNGLIKRSTLKTTMSLDPSILCKTSSATATAATHDPDNKSDGQSQKKKPAVDTEEISC